MGEDSGEKTEEPTPHKLREGRKKASVPCGEIFIYIVNSCALVTIYKCLLTHARWLKAIRYTAAPFFRHERSAASKSH